MLHSRDLVPYWFTRQIVTQGGDYPIPPNCNGFIATNIAPVGGATAAINGYPINPPIVAGANGESFALGGNLGEVMAEKQLEIIFGAGVSRVYLTFKFYSSICD